MRNPTNARRRPSLVALVAALALVAAACGGADGGAAQVASLQTEDGDTPVAAGDLAAAERSDASDITEAPTREEAMLAFTQCMRDNGVDMPDPEMDSDGNLRLSRPGGEGEFDRDSVVAAREACADHLESVAQGFRNIDQTELQDNLLAYAQCVRDNGYPDIADPDVSNFGPGSGGEPGRGPFGDVDREDPEFIAADQACRELFGGFGPGGRRGPGGGGSG